MIYDCFLYNGEKDILDLRFGILKDVVDRFVVVESTVTFSGKPKQLSFVSTDPKFVHVVINDTPDSGANRWARERFQRDAMIRGLKDCKFEDIVCISDADEIPDPEALKAGKLGGYQCQISNYYLNTVEQGPIWIGPVVLNYFQIKSLGPQKLRDIRYDLRYISPGGWHFTYATSRDGIVKKIESFSHSEYDTPEGQKLVLDSRELLRSFVTGNSCQVMDIDKSYFPQYLRDNREKFKHLLR